jgi:multidrug efflux pump subunit AcrA (membrane-fusion protein)
MRLNFSEATGWICRLSRAGALFVVVASVSAWPAPAGAASLWDFLTGKSSQPAHQGEGAGTADQPSPAPANSTVAADQSQPAAASQPVSVAFPRTQRLTEYIELTGNAASVNTVKLIARVEGYLEKIHFLDGQLVKKDALLFTIQQDQYKAQLEQAPKCAPRKPQFIMRVPRSVDTARSSGRARRRRSLSTTGIIKPPNRNQTWHRPSPKCKSPSST